MSASMGVCASTGPLGATLAAALQFLAASQCLLQVPYPKQAVFTNGSSFDFIIVGGGSAGSALAARLSELHQFQVLLVEAGGDPPVESIIPGFRNSLKDSPYDWNFTTVNDGYSSQAMAEQLEKQIRGKMLGGTGSLNDMVYSRGHPMDYKEWAELLGDVWNWNNVLPYFKKTEQLTDEKILHDSELMQYHGLDGEIEVSGSGQLNCPTTKFLEAFHELGMNIVNDMTYPYLIGAGRFSHTIRSGRRDSSLTAMLNKVHSGNLHVLKNTFVTKVLIENDKAIGIKAVLNGKEIYIFADKEVIVSAGTFNTAKLLMLSGVGPKDHLEDLEIKVVQDLPVGDNLHDHVMNIYFLATETGTCVEKESAALFDVIKYLYDATGPLSNSHSMGVYLPQKDRDSNVPYFAIYPTCLPKGLITNKDCMSGMGYNSEICEKIVSENAKSEIISLAVVLLKPQSRGKIRLSSTKPMDKPLIYSGTFSNDADLEGYPDTIKFALSLANTTYFKEKGTRVIDLTSEKCKRLKDTEVTLCHVKETALAAWHSVGTAAMGTVVDAELRVQRVRGLRVVDASVMPAVVRGNTNAPVIMIAERAADFIKKAYQADEN